MKSFLILSLFFCTILANAQNAYLALDSSIRLKGARSFTSIKVIDQRRYNHANTDTLMDRFSNELVDHLIADYGTYIMRKSAREDNELLLVVHNLTLHEMPNDVPVCSAMMSADAFVGKNGSYQMCYEMSLYMETPRPKSAVNPLGTITADLLSRFLDSASHIRYVVNRLPAPREFSLKEATELWQQKHDSTPVLKAAAFKEGVYLTKKDFFNLHPDSAHYALGRYYNSDKKKSETGISWLKENGKPGGRMKENFFYAAYINGQWYRSSPNGLRSLTVDSSGIHTQMVIRQRDLLRKNTGMAIAGYLSFGIVGEIVAESLRTSTAAVETEKVRLVPVDYKCFYDPIWERFIPEERLNLYAE